MSRYSPEKNYYDQGRRAADYGDKYDAPTFEIDQGWNTPDSVVEAARKEYREGWKDGGGK